MSHYQYHAAVNQQFSDCTIYLIMVLYVDDNEEAQSSETQEAMQLDTNPTER